MLAFREKPGRHFFSEGEQEKLKLPSCCQVSAPCFGIKRIKAVRRLSPYKCSCQGSAHHFSIKTL
jgi:hypothetical protein